MSMIILFAGFPASGKTTLSFKIGKLLKIPVISKDSIRDLLTEAGIDYELAGIYSYQLISQLVSDFLSSRISIIIDSSSTKNKSRIELVNLASRFSIDILLIECICSDESVLRTRLNKRKYSPHRVTNWDKYTYVVDQFDKFEDDFIRVDTIKPIEFCVEKILEHIQSNRCCT